MDEKMLLKLQNGSDIRGVAMEGVEGEDVTLTHDVANVIGAAFVNFLAEKIGKPANKLKIAVGHDSRLSAESLKEAAIQGAMNLGARVFDCGLSSTPAMFMSIVFEDTQMDGAIMITASHLPYNRNGMKFFTAEGGLEKADIKAILKGAAKLEPAEYDISDVETLELIDLYSEYLCEKIRVGANLEENYMQPLSGMKIVVDAGNGA
ncbi:MAG TPA: phosphomannomutase/phosphoglucomutase, partial [Anaerovibrio sp.]|nr:phosphomannomutase/phosphoglucomutase [Anaerovibrio sp.]